MNNKVYQNVFRDSKPSRENSWSFLESLVGIAKMLRKILRFLGLCAKAIKSSLQGRSQDCNHEDSGFVRQSRTSSLSKMLSGSIAVTSYCIQRIPGLCRLIPISWWSRWIEKFIHRSELDWRVLFDHALVNLPILRPTRNHTHGNSASYRSSVNIALKQVVSRMGFVPYQVSGSKADSRDSDGCRYFYGTKDLKIPYKDDKIGKRHVLLMTDVDYHLNINDYLRYGRPIIMYTFTPKVPGKCTDEYSYYIRDDRVYYSVSGGASYDHALWDYEGDTVSVIDDKGQMIVYDICQKEIEGDEDHRIVGLYPTAMVPFPFWINFDASEGFQRRKFTHNGYNIIRQDGIVSLSPTGSTVSYTISESVFLAMRTRFEKAKTPLTLGDVERHLSRVDIQDPQLAAAQVLECVERLTSTELLDIPRCPKTTAISTCYQTLTPIVNEDGRESAVLLTSPLVTQPAVFPMKSYNNDVATIRGRVNEVRNGMWPSKWYEESTLEFIQRLIPDDKVGRGVPLSIEEVIALQNRPAQVARTKLAEHQLGVECGNTLKAFIKSEGYSNFTDPRNITTMSASLTVMLSGYTYAFKNDVLKDKWWYAPGQDPETMIRNLSTICVGGSIASDFSRLDGSVSMFLQLKVVFAAYMRWVNDACKTELKNHFDSVFKNVAITANGYRYQPGYGTRSGSPLTTDGNTMILAYVCFCALLKTGLTPKDAWNGLGLYCGDDAVNSVHPRFMETFALVCKDLGLTVELEKLEPNGHVPFLGRIFYDPVTCPDSIQDPRRTLPKLHLAAKREIFSIEQMAYNKAAGYYVTDKLTPIISDWAHKVMVITGCGTVRSLTPEDAWRLSRSWPQVDAEKCREVFKKTMKIDELELAEWESQLRNTTNLDSFPIVWDNDRQVKIDCVFDGELLRNSATLRYIKPKVNQIRKALLECQDKNKCNTLTKSNNPEATQTLNRSKPPTGIGSSTSPNQAYNASSNNTSRKRSTTAIRARRRTLRRSQQ